jgi:HEAT repeat protein
MSARLAWAIALVAASAVTRASAAPVRASATSGREQTAAQTRAEPTAAELAAAIDALGSFDLAARTAASRVVRRTPVERAVPALTAAGKSHRQSYVRYRALALLSGLDDPSIATTMRGLLDDRDDRVRIVASSWFEHRTDPSVLPRLIERFTEERSEYVRPALTRAIAAHGADPRARDALLPLVTRGEDAFRSAVIVAIGDYRGRFAVEAIRSVAVLDGPLQEDAILSLGRIGERADLARLSELQQTAPAERRPAIAAAVCLMGLDCETQQTYLRETVTFAAGRAGQERNLRAAARALGVLAASGRADAFKLLFDVGVPSRDPGRVPIALAVGTACLRNPSGALDALETRTDRDGFVLLLRDAFDLLSQEDYEQERFFRHVRNAYWGAAEGSPRRALADALVRGLEI